MSELEQLGERIAEQAAHLDAAMHRLLADLREFDARGGWHLQGAQSCAHWLAWRVGWGLVTARQHVRVAGKLADLPAIDDALRRGEMSYSKVRAMVRVATPANELLLLEHARITTASQLEVLCRKYALVQRHGQDPDPRGDLQRRYVRRRDTEDGMVKIEAVLHPEEAELVWTMLNHTAAQLARESDFAGAGVTATPCQVTTTSGTANATLANPDAMLATGDVTMVEVLAADSPTQSSDTVADPVDDSAESPSLPGRIIIAKPAANAGSLARGAHTGSRADALDDSAESGSPSACPPTIAKPAANAGSLADIVSTAADARSLATVAVPGSLDDSAEPLAVTAVPDCDVEARAGTTVTGSGAPDPGTPGSDAPGVDAPGWDAPGRSLLDRLLDEADALRAAEPMLRPEPETLLEDARLTGLLSSGCNAERAPGVLHQRVDAARRAFNRADALMAIAQGYLRGDKLNRSPIDVVLTIADSSLRLDTTHAIAASDPVEVGEMGETFVSRAAARRLSCDAGVVEVVEDERSMPLSVGRKRRTIAGALKRALYKRDGMCTFPSCTNRLFLEGHHIKHWADGGETSLRNALLLCSTHHRYVHEYGYTIELGEDERPRFRDRHGRLIGIPDHPAMTDLGWPRIRAENAPLEIDADTAACGWDGTPADYGAMVGHLLAVDAVRPDRK